MSVMVAASWVAARKIGRKGSEEQQWEIAGMEDWSSWLTVARRRGKCLQAIMRGDRLDIDKLAGGKENQTRAREEPRLQKRVRRHASRMTRKVELQPMMDSSASSLSAGSSSAEDCTLFG
jgi:hypothetical protein